MTNKEAINHISRNKSVFQHDTEMIEALELAIKALEIVDDVKHKIYRNENCDRKRRCYDYIGYHCAGCNGSKKEK